MRSVYASAGKTLVWLGHPNSSKENGEAAMGWLGSVANGSFQVFPKRRRRFELEFGILRHGQPYVNCSANHGFAGDGSSKKLQCPKKCGSAMEHDFYSGSGSVML